MKKVEKTKTIEQKTEITTAPVAPVEEKVGGMPKRTFILILLLVLITVGLLAIALLPGVKSPLVATPAPALNYVQTQLSFSAPITATPSGYKTDVLISTGKNKVTATQLEVAYDPKILTNVNIKPGAFFTNPTILLKKVDAVNGRLTYVLGIGLGGTPATGKGTVATITFSTVASATATQTSINFEPKTAATAVGYAQSVLKQTTGVLFSFGPTPTP
jgi:hypothetical protein